jgi:hypothetical protein
VAEHFWRDHTGRLTVDRAGIASTDYPAVCRAVADVFDLKPDGEFVVGPDQMFWDFRRGDIVVGMDWDVWMEFMVVAKTAAAEPLVRQIGEWLGTRVPRLTYRVAPDCGGPVLGVSAEPGGAEAL